MWKPTEHSFVKNKNFQNRIREFGWLKSEVISNNQLNDLRMLFDENHKINQVGMFYSMYSKDLAYRKKVRDGILTILAPTLKSQFEDYKVAYAVFVVKTPGKETEFFLHQDPSIVDESKYSSLHLWIPLEKITDKNGPLCVIEKTHMISQPFRGITVPSFFKGSEGLLREYLQPIFLEAGEALFLDPRVVHNSLANVSDKTRVAVLVGIIPLESEIILSHCEEGPESGIVEQHLFSDDYFQYWEHTR